MIQAEQYRMSRAASAVYITGVVALLGGTFLFAAIILLPFFALGIYHMSSSQIWSSSFDLSWHPFYRGMRESLYERAIPVIVIWLLAGGPLLMAYCFELLISWRCRTLRANLQRMSLLMPSIVAVILFFAYAGKLLDWIGD